MRRLIGIIFTTLVALVSNAQEVVLPTYLNHMMENAFVLSPSYAGIGAGLQIRLNGASQWVGVEDAPDTQSLSIEARLKDELGAGLVVFNDKNGFTKQMGIKLTFAYHLTLDDFTNSFLSFSLGSNFTQFSLDTENYNNYNQVNENLPSISQNNVNFDFGTLYRLGSFGLSFNVFNILNKDVKNVLTGEPSKLRRYSTYGVYTYRLNDEYQLEPSVYAYFFESDNRTQTDVNIKIRRKIRDGYVWLGSSLKILNDNNFNTATVAPLIGIKKKQFYVSYGTSFNLSEIAFHNVGSHMITLGFDYDPKPSLARCTQDQGMF